MKTRKVPMRMCIGCREMKPKNELCRIVASENGVVVDSSGKAQGRGAYICKNPACIQRAKKQGSVTRALSAKPGDELFGRLEELIPDGH